MITTCTHCQARYQLDSEKIPGRKIKVRCPACQGVFHLDGTLATAATVETVAAEPATFATPPSAPESQVPDPSLVSGVVEDSLPAPAQPAASVDSGLAGQTEAEVPSPVAVLEEDPQAGGRKRRRRSKEEMMARALVSDILVYNRDARDAALAEGNLLEALGAEIKKSWELYKEKVTPEVANSTNHFRDALNEILADGQKVF